MKKILLLALLCIMTICSYAQRVYKEGSTYVVECKGMPETSYTKLAKPQKLAQTVNGITGINTAAANKAVTYKFEVQIRNMNESSTRDEAITTCTYKGTGWRLPTQRELQLIWTLHEGLKKLDDSFTPLDAGPYWSATDFVSGYGYMVFFNTGFTGAFSTATYSKARVRCIREIIE